MSLLAYSIPGLLPPGDFQEYRETALDSDQSEKMEEYLSGYST
jgi:hypothetical protein